MLPPGTQCAPGHVDERAPVRLLRPALSDYHRKVSAPYQPYADGPQPYGPGPQPMQPYPPAPGGRPPATSTKGPKITFWIGVATLVVSIALVVLGSLSLWRSIPTDVLTMDGSPGDAVVGVVDGSTTAEVDLDGDTEYAVYFVRTSGLGGTGARPVVTAPDEDPVPVGSASYSSSVTMGSTRAEAIASFTTGQAGAYTIDATATTGDDARLFIIEDNGIGGFLGGLFSGIAALLGGAFFGIAALTLLITGGVMWGMRRSNARRLGLR